MQQMPSDNPTAPRPASGQFTTVHALRGFAALWVVFFHARNFGAFLGSGVGRRGWLSTILFDDGRGGVAIFFVLSGFVIAHSLWRIVMNARSIGHFMLRRSIRLDPPYWASIALALLFFGVRGARHGAHLEFGPGVVVAHLLYLQEFLRLPEIQVVYWTLTYEIQFYLVYALLLWWISHAEQTARHRLVVWLPAILLVVAAFVAAAEPREWVLHGLFLNYWHAFAAGVLAYLGGFRRNNLCLVLAAALSCVMLISASSTIDVFNTPAALTALGLALLGRFNKLSGLSGHPFKGLGTISYSLYLVHVPAIMLLISVAASFLGRSYSDSVISFLFVVGGAVAVAMLFWWAIEWPSHKFARHIRKAPKVESDYAAVSSPKKSA